MQVHIHTLNVDFTPTDNANYSGTSRNVTINVSEVTPTVTWNNPANITYETALNLTQLNATASVPGTFVYTPESGTVLSAGTHTLHVDFTPTDTSNYSGISANITITVERSTPTIVWSNPADTIYGTALNSTQLNASASMLGTFTYNPSSGTVMSAGMDHQLQVVFTPTDTANYTSETKKVTINVQKSAPTITWSNPADIIYGTVLNSTQLNASASIPGTFVYNPASGNVLSVGTQTLHVDFTPTDNTNYSSASKNVTINVLKSTPTIAWSSPADIIYGTALNSTHLNASALVPGTFVYTPTLGTVLGVGNQTLHVDFTPTDVTNYTSATKIVTINVQKATPAITWSNPADIIFGTALNDTQLEASASISGIFTYTPALGTVLSAGNQTLHVDFTPTDNTNYSGTSANITLNVLKANPIITWSSPADLIYGTALNSTHLNASSSVPGSFVYTPGSGAILLAGNQILHVEFTPEDATNYTNASKEITINIQKANSVITWNNPTFRR